MHEMSIAMSILEIAGQQARQADARRIAAIDVEIGTLAGVEIDSLEFCFEVARRNDPLTRDAELVIERIAAVGRCPACDLDVPLESFVAICPECGQGVEIRQGRELRVRSLRVD